MRRRDEPEPSIGDVRMNAQILVPDASVGKAEVTLQIHSARVRYMSSYNAYLPAGLPMSLLSGEASLVGDLRFKPNGARGEMLLVADGVRVALGDEELSGNLRADLLVRDGSAQEMRFDISGSSVLLDKFKVIGRVGSVQARDWHGRLQLEDTQVLWRKPMHLDMTAGIRIKDTRPVVALLDNVRGEHSWTDNLLADEDLGGHLKLQLDGERAVLADAFLGSERISIGAKGLADAASREGMLYLRCGI
jgi:translocation and assembly module TamB